MSFPVPTTAASRTTIEPTLPSTTTGAISAPSRKRRSSDNGTPSALPLSSLSTATNMPASSATTATKSHGTSASTSSPKHNGTNNAVSVKVRLKRFHAVAAWTWNANDHVCGICQSPFEGVCPGVKYPGEDCPVVWGKCGHAFHLQCVSKWLGQTASKNSCPICRQEWEFGQNPVNTTSSPTDPSATAASASTAANEASASSAIPAAAAPGQP